MFPTQEKLLQFCIVGIVIIKQFATIDLEKIYTTINFAQKMYYILQRGSLFRARYLEVEFRMPPVQEASIDASSHYCPYGHRI